MSLQYNHAKDLVEKVSQSLMKPPPGIMLPWWPSFSETVGGLRGGELTVLAAPTGAGKTQFLANLAAQLWLSGIPTFAAPVETGDDDFLIRMFSVLEQQDWNTGKAYPPERVSALIAKYANRINTSPLYIANYDNRVAVEDMEAMLRYQRSAHGVQVALLDNLNFFLKITRASDQLLEIDEAVRQIGNVAKQTKMHIILICHPRKTEGDGRINSEYDIKGSSTIVQEAWNVILWNRPDPKSGYPLTLRELVYKKSRKRGTIYNRKFWFRYDGGKYLEIREADIVSGMVGR